MSFINHIVVKLSDSKKETIEYDYRYYYDITHPTLLPITTAPPVPQHYHYIP